MRVTLSFARGDLAYANSIITSTPLTGRDAALLFFVAPYLLDRRAWEPMPDADWDNLQAEISLTLDRLATPL